MLWWWCSCELGATARSGRLRCPAPRLRLAAHAALPPPCPLGWCTAHLYRRYGALKTLGEKKTAYNEYVQQRKKEEAEEARQRRMQVRTRAAARGGRWTKCAGQLGRLWGWQKEAASRRRSTGGVVQCRRSGSRRGCCQPPLRAIPLPLHPGSPSRAPPCAAHAACPACSLPLPLPRPRRASMRCWMSARSWK